MSKQIKNPKWWGHDREPCECPTCGSAASHAFIEMLVKLERCDSNAFVQCSLTVPDPERDSSDWDCVPTVTRLVCDDCGMEFAPRTPMFAEFRVSAYFG